MKKIFMRGLLAVSFTWLFCPTVSYSAVLWEGGQTKTSADNIVNDDLIIGSVTPGTITLNGGVHFKATTGTQAITISGNSTLQGINGIGGRFYLEAASGSTIDVVIDDDFALQGSPDGTDLLFVFNGAGTYNFKLASGKHFRLTKTGSFGGVQAYLLMFDGTPTPEVVFERQTKDNDNVYIEIGPESVLTFAAATPVPGTEKGMIIFKPANDADGRMVLQLEDKGGLIITGHKVNTPAVTDEYLLTDFDKTLPAGLEARVVVENGASNEHAGLLVLNKNKTLGEYLIDPWYNLGARCDNADFNGSFSGERWGFVVGNNAILEIGDYAYLDYVALSNNICPEPEDLPCDVCANRIKARNPSALIIDGYHHCCACPATIKLDEHSAVYFRSGVACDGTVENGVTDPHAFTIDPCCMTTREGEMVFDVEDTLHVCGSDPSKLEILSLEVGHTGGSVLIDTSENIFPQRTFARDHCDRYRVYNKAYFFVNDRMNLCSTWLVHTDQNHKVCEHNDRTSEPAYVGGETFVFKCGCGFSRPKIAFYNSYLYVHTNIAVTGLDLFVPNLACCQSPCLTNVSQFKFFHNGYEIDNSTGRQMILGTQVGSMSCGECCPISKDAHLDVMQEIPCMLPPCAGQCPPCVEHKLELRTGANDPTIVEDIGQTNIDAQYSIHTLFLGNASNISIGSQNNPFVDQSFAGGTSPTMYIYDNFFSFETRGGCQCLRETSSVSGEGGIFVDTDGALVACAIVNMSTMVTKSGTGYIHLPRRQVFFDSRIGVADWMLDMSKQIDRYLIFGDECISDYTLDWINVKKDFANFTPYPVDTFNPCSTPAVTHANINRIPAIYGYVDQLQIKASRIADRAHIKIDGGWVKELIHLSGCHSAEAPTSVIVLEDDGRVGLGSAHRNVDSLEASVVLGLNGITIIANGDGQVDLNEDIIVDNMCHVLAGPDFGTHKQDAPDVLTFKSETPRTITVKACGVLDLSSFRNKKQVVQLAGKVRLILEPGAKVVWSEHPQDEGGILQVTDEACIVCDRVTRDDKLYTYQQGELYSLTKTDNVRVKFIGKGELLLDGCGSLTIEDGAYLGVETIDRFSCPVCISDVCDPGTCNILLTDLNITVKDQAKFLIGVCCSNGGGSFQVGNTKNHENSTVNFTLTLDGNDACFGICDQSFCGFGAGIADKKSPIPNNWLIDTTHNIGSITLNLGGLPRQVSGGCFMHRKIYRGDDVRASLLAFGQRDRGTPFTLYTRAIEDATSNVSRSSILGGGNIALITGSGSPITPTVLTTDGVINPRLSVGILASTPLLNPNPGVAQMLLSYGPGNAIGLYNFLKTYDVDMHTRMANANAAPSHVRNQLRLGYVDDGVIYRAPWVRRYAGQGDYGSSTVHEHSSEVGAVIVWATGPTITNVFQLP